MIEIQKRTIVIVDNEKEFKKLCKSKVGFEHDIYLQRLGIGKFKVIKNRMGDFTK